MRIFFIALFALVTASLCSAADLAIVRVWTGYRAAESFERISEYFGKKEDVVAEHVIRTQPNERSGYYFLVRLQNEDAEISGAHLELQLITPFSTETKSYTFDSAIPHGSHAFHLGLTGTDWPGKPKDEAVAWQLRILSATGTELGRTQSFLWSKPEKK
jgi:hypothetical protein